MTKYLLKNGTLVDHKHEFKVDLLVEDGKIMKIEANMVADDAEVIDCTNLYVMPGLIDVHVHFREPGNIEKEDFYSGSRAAVRGGVTTIFDMPNTNPPTTNPELIEAKIAMAAEKSLINFGVYGGATPHNAQALAAAKDRIMGIKIYMGSSTGDLLVDKKEYWQEFFSLGMQIVVHAEHEARIVENTAKFHDIHDPQIHGVIRGNDVAAMATERAVALGQELGTKLHIAHMSTKEEVLIVRRAKNEGYKDLTCEVTPHHLFLNNLMYEQKGNYLRVNPPVRSVEDVRALWEDGIGLNVIDMVATDHAPHLKVAKDQDYWKAPSGMPGVQEMLLLLLSKVQTDDLTLPRLVELTSYNPAKQFAVANKGQLKEGYDADLVIVDMNKKGVLDESMLESRCGWSNYTGLEFNAWPVKTFVNGNLVWDGEVISDEWKGKLVTRSDV
ncbi:dihydroorotase [Candidatus Peregrinibacteria bacterium CG_4_9_14_0_2_um_filter_41_14]|nr:MAG: dihydroorotase [Candidatus Peregrinibacteria bacterium CG_4_10_14_0_2_um_filter_41_8]PJC38035.1 MAG: dihydroorotase [Candidatus Peregrinibacteria bacterium CG_4_9_14_0_2_um_filter_41_14]